MAVDTKVMSAKSLKEYRVDIFETQPEKVVTAREAALNAANAVRANMGYPPVDHLYKGVPCVGDNCPITNTIYDDDISRDEWHISTDDAVHVQSCADGDNYRLFPLDDDVHLFIGLFDDRLLVDLIDHRLRVKN